MKPLPEMTERVPGVRLQSKFFVGRKRIWKPGSHEELLSNQESRKIGEEYRWRENLRLIREICGRFARLHELDRGAIGIAHVNHAFPGVRARLESLCLAHRAPTRRRNLAEHSVDIIHCKRNMRRSDVASSEIGSRAVRRGVVFEQLNSVTGRLKNSDRDLSTGHSSHFTGEITCMVRSMRKLEAEYALPEDQRPVDTCDRKTGMLRRNDVE